MYHRIQDCWNRPIASCPGAWIDLIDRKRAPQGSNIPPVYDTHNIHIIHT